MTATTLPQNMNTGAASAPTTSNRAKFNFKSAFLVTLVAIIAGLSQATNFFAYPYYQDSEGTNISHAWALIEEGELSPYTYDYDEAPIGSIVLSAWVSAVGGIDAFGNSINTGRVMMLVVHIVSVMLLYGVTYKLTNSDLAAVIAAIVFALSPLVTVLQRRVLLDNIMLMWMLASVYSISGDNRRIEHYFSSAIFFAIAVLTSISAFYLLPAMLYIIHITAHEHHRRFAYGLWTTLVLVLTSMFPLYAAMRLELFPQGWWLFSGDYPHVSLWERLIDRGPDTGRFLDYGSNLLPSFLEWTQVSYAAADPILIYGGLICVAFVGLMSVENRRLRTITALFMSYMLFLLFGGRVVQSDVIPMLPILAMSVGVFAGSAVKWLTGSNGNVFLRLVVGVGALAVMLYPFGVFYMSATYIYEEDQTSGQLEALEWVGQYVPEDAVIVTDNYAFVELRESFPNAHHYWKVDTDPDVRLTQLEDNWCNIDYIVTSPQLLADISTFELGLSAQAMRNSNVLIVQDNNGWPVEIRQVRKEYCASNTIFQ